MKKIFPILLSVLLVVSLAIPAFATDVEKEYYNGYLLPSIDPILEQESECPYASIVYNIYTESFSLNLYSKEPFFDDGFTIPNNTVSITYSTLGDEWGSRNRYITQYPTTVLDPFWVNFEVSNDDTGGIWTPELNVCDGSSCPATDSNHDNICDDCGMPLTYSLRSTEYDYAVSLAEDRANYGYPFYAIFREGDRYVIHVSKNIMSSPDGTTLEGQEMMYTKTTANDNGSFSLTGWYNGYYAHTDEFIYANHTISNFPLVPPFLTTMEGPLEEMGQTTMETMTTLALCGVGCLALLILLALFGKRSLIFLK